LRARFVMPFHRERMKKPPQSTAYHRSTSRTVYYMPRRRRPSLPWRTGGRAPLRLPGRGIEALPPAETETGVLGLQERVCSFSAPHAPGGSRDAGFARPAERRPPHLGKMLLILKTDIGGKSL